MNNQSSQTKTYYDIDKLYPWDRNPRNVKPEDFERLKAQLREFDQYKPLVVTVPGEVLGGNIRLSGMRSIREAKTKKDKAFMKKNPDAFSKVWVSVVDPKDEKEKIRYALSDNDTVGYYVEDELKALLISADFDEDTLKNFKVDMGTPISLKDLIDKLEEEAADGGDLSYKSQYQVVVECESEAQQEEAYKMLAEMGYTCKVLTL